MSIQLTQQEKKIKDLRSQGFSLGEIAQELKIPRKKVEMGLEAKGEFIPETKTAPTSEKKATKKKTPAKRK